MKKTIFLLLAAACVSIPAVAQDLIQKRDSTRIEANVIEITTETVKYKRFSNPQGPTYVLPAAQVAYIRYANGEKEQFAAPQVIPATPLTPATPLSQPLAGGEYVLKQYKIGDYYERDGVKGVVCRLDDDMTHGLILSLEEIFLPWSTFRKPDLSLAGADDRTSGEANMEKVARYIADNNLTWDSFPAFKWCREQGEGWYLPSIDELLTIGHNYNGGSRMQNNRQARNQFNDALKNNGGKRMDRLVYYFSSSEMDEKNAYTTHTGIEPPYVIEIPKYSKFLVRAVRRF